MDNQRLGRHIIVSGFNIIDGVFISISYHTDLVIYRMMYDYDNRIITCMMGPYGKVTEKFTIDDKRLLEYFGTHISEELYKFIEWRCEQCTTGS